MAKLIMVVDDEEYNREIVKSNLSGSGYDVISANNGDDCLDKLKKYNPDLILMDIMMPGTPVREVIAKIKNINIAYLSVVRVSESEKADLIKGNIVGFIQKPFDKDDLLKKVMKYSKK